MREITTPLLEVIKLKKEYNGVCAVEDISFEIRKGEIVCIVGPNGCGKTTLVNMLSGFEKPDKGAIVYKNINIANMAANKICRMGIVRTFQDTRPFFGLTVFENIFAAKIGQLKIRNALDMLLYRRYKTNRKIYQESMALIKHIGLFEKRNELANTLSQGQAKLLEMARAIATSPDLLLLDEPTAGVFPEMVDRMIYLIETMKKLNTTIIVVEHNLEFVKEISERIIAFELGKIIYDK